MRWIRDHIRRGSWIALLALAINLGLSFGHVHAIASHAAPIVSQPDGGGSQGHHDGDRADLLCPICMAASAMAHALAAPPPALPLAALLESPTDLTIEPVLAVLQSPGAAFHSRAPPIS